MRKFINGKYEEVEVDEAKQVKENDAPPTAPIISVPARRLMEANAHIDFSEVVGTGKDGQITKPDVDKHIAATDSKTE